MYATETTESDKDARCTCTCIERRDTEVGPPGTSHRAARRRACPFSMFACDMFFPGPGARAHRPQQYLLATAARRKAEAYGR
eukprot:scaffold12707_cov142-Isochrysis_galbana.AAC.1